MRRTLTRVLLAAAVLVVAVLTGRAGPVAAGPVPITYAHVLSFGSAGTGNGQFGQVRDVATDGAGFLYTVDEENDRVQKFTDDGTFVTSWNNTCIRCLPNLLNGPTAVAASPTAVWVADTLNSRIVQYTPSGTFVRKITSPAAGLPGAFGQPRGIALDSSGRVYVVGSADLEVHRFNADGTWSTDFTVPTTGTSGVIEVDDAGNMFVGTLTPARVTKLNHFGTLQWQSDLFAAGLQLNPSGITVDPTNDHVLVATSGAGTAANTVADLEPVNGGRSFMSPTLLGGSMNVSSPFGMAADADGFVYIAERSIDQVEKIGRTATLTLVYDTDADGSLDQTFTLSGPGPTQTVLVDDDTDPTLPNTRVVTGLAPATWHVDLSQGQVKTITCSNGIATSNYQAHAVDVPLLPNQSVTCQFYAEWIG